MFILSIWSLFIFNKSLLHYFIQEGDIEQVRALLDNGVDIAASECKDLLPPLHFAIKIKQNEILQLLLDNNADPNMKTSMGTTPLITASIYENQEAVKILLDNMADPNIADNNVYFVFKVFTFLF